MKTPQNLRKITSPEYPTDQLISYTIFYFYLTNMPAAIEVFPELLVGPFDDLL